MKKHFLITLLLFILAACGNDGQTTTPTTSQGTQIVVGQETGGSAAPAVNINTPPPPAITNIPPSPIPPTATPEPPLAARVNGQPILLTTFENELRRYEQAQQELAAQGLSATVDGVSKARIVLDGLIEQAIIAQAAQARGVAISPETVAQRVQMVINEAGGEAVFQSWLATNQMTQIDFEQGVAAELLAQEVMGRVLAEMPATVEQVRARYIQVDDAALAQSIWEQINNGGDFAVLAGQYSLDQTTAANGGDLDYFSRGTLLVPAVEEAAFSLNVGQTSPVIPVLNYDGNGTTYYIIQTTERGQERPVPPAQRTQFMQDTFLQWLQNERAQAVIELFVNLESQ